eukprot:361603-Chlamydomonas_euryale.AAC.20
MSRSFRRAPTAITTLISAPRNVDTRSVTRLQHGVVLGNGNGLSVDKHLHAVWIGGCRCGCLRAGR